MANQATAKLTGLIIDGRYELLQPLGEGGMAIVYQARRLRINDEVAIKILRSETITDKFSQSRFEQEAQAAARIKHPNIVTIHDFGVSAEGLVYLVMEKLDGPTLEQEIERVKNFNLERTLSVIAPVCRAIGAAHQEGLAHLDLKPANIILHQLKDGSELIKVLDFGIVRGTTNFQSLATPATLWGTPIYMSPEQCQGQPLDVRSDVYSLAVIAYEMLTGRVPFNESSLMETLQAQIHQKPQPLRYFKPEIPINVENVILRALSKNPDHRQANAALLAQELVVTTGILPLAKSGPLNFSNNWKRQTGSFVGLGGISSLSGMSTNLNNSGALKMEAITRRLARPTPDFEQFIGRRREFERLTNEYQQLLAGRSRSLVVLGEQGTGLSRLGEEFKNWTRSQGGAVLLTRFHEQASEGQPLFRPIVDLIRRAVNIRRSEITQDRQIAKMVWERTGVEVPEHLFGNDHEFSEKEKWEIRDTVAQVLARVARGRPGVMIYDNVQAAPPIILELLSHLTRSQGQNFFMVFLIRSENATQKDHPCHQWINSLSRIGCEIIQIQPFTQQETRLLLDTIFGRLEIVERDIERIYTISRGNPYYVAEILRFLLNENRIYLKDDSWYCDSLADFTLPLTLHQLAAQKLARLDNQLLDILRQAAVIGQKFSFDVLATVSGVAEDSLIDLLERAKRENIIKELDRQVEEYQFHDPTLRFALYESIPKRRRRRLHLHIAQEIEQGVGSNHQKLQRCSPHLLYHFHEAKDHEKTFAYGRMAAEAARNNLGLAEAEKYYAWTRAAIAALKEENVNLNNRELMEINLGAADVALHLSRFDEVERLINESSELAGDDPFLGARLELTKSRTALFRSNFEMALQAGEAGLKLIESLNEPWLESRLSLMVGRALGALGRTEECLDCLECNLSLAQQTNDRVIQGQVLSYMGMMLGQIGNYAESLRFIQEGLRLIHITKDRQGELIALLRLGLIYLQINQYEQALQTYEVGIELARALENRMLEAYFRGAVGDIYYHQGEIDIARDYFQQLLVSSQTLGTLFGESMANYKLGLVALKWGMLTDALKLLELALGQSLRSGERRTVVEIRCAIGSAQEKLGQIPVALNTYRTTIQESQNILYPNSEWQARYGLANCLIAQGRITDAQHELETALEIIENLRNSLPPEINMEHFMQDKIKVGKLLNDLTS
jgi:serine/threonine protein kinase/tetratricopeptide (TPR) repeat protein